MSVKAIYIAGPTASGKSETAMKLALSLDGEIVGADSMQIYKGFDISTAKPSPSDRDTVRHHMVDFLDPHFSYSVSQYVRDAEKCVEDIISRGKIPIICGGTGLYLDALVNGMTFHVQDVDPDIRRRLKERLDEEGPDVLFEELRGIDPVAAGKIDPHNTRRLVRALEVIELTGKTPTQLNEESRQHPAKFDSVGFILYYSDREKLYDRINRRVDNMIENGLVSEAELWYNERDKLSDTANQAIGCKEFKPYFDSEKSLDECVEDLKRNTRRYAKRQMTWFIRNETAHFIDLCELSGPEEVLNYMLEILKGEGIGVG